MSDVIYLYGFVPAAAPAPPPELAGLGDAAVRLLELGPVSAVVSELPAAAYGRDVVEARLDDLAWVGEQGIAHERVVLWFVDHAQILPASLFSMYSGAPMLREMLAGAVPGIAARLDALGDAREWNLKVAYDAAEMARHGAELSAEVRRLDEELAAAAPGRRYLMQRKRADLLKSEIGHAARRVAGGILDELRPHAVASKTVPLPASDAAAGTVVLNAALLVSRAAEPAFRAAADARIAEARALGVLATLSGPWAAYRFVEGAADV